MAVKKLSIKVAQKRRMFAFDRARNVHSKKGDPADWLRREAEARLAEFDREDCLFRNHLMVCTDFCCDACQVLKGKNYTADEARSSNVLPQRSCTNEINAKGYAFCLCTWEINLDAYRESRDRKTPSPKAV